MHSTSCRRSVSVVAKKFLKVALISTLAYLGTPSGSAMALAYSFTTIDVPGGFATRPTGVNDAGEIVGQFFDDNGRHGFLFKSGTFSTLGPRGALQSVAADINNAGHIVGSFTDSAGQHGFLNVDGAYTTIDFPGATSTFALAIDNAGRIFGGFDAADHFSYLFIAEGSNFTAFPSFPDDGVNDFNDSGQVVGIVDDGHNVSGFVADIDGGNFDQFVYPGSVGTKASGINNAGQIVQTFLDGINDESDFCYFLRGFVNVGGSSGTFIPLDHPAAIRDESSFLGQKPSTLASLV